MAVRPAGIGSDLSAAAAVAGNRVQIDPVGIVIYCTELGISMNAAPNSTLVPVEYILTRRSTIGTGTAGTAVKIQKASSAALVSTVQVENTVDGTLVDTLHRWFVPVVSGVIWVAAPNREPDCGAAEFIGVGNVTTLGASINATCYMVWEE